MAHREAPGERLILEFRARDAWNQRDYSGAQRLADAWADLCRASDDEEGLWNASFLAGECLRKQGLMDESRLVAERLELSPVTQRSPALKARVSTLRAFALQGSGDLPSAVEAARAAVKEAMTGPDHTEVAVEAMNALIAALAESGLLPEAWKESLLLDDLLKQDRDNKYAGQSYWAIGNVAFLLDRISDGVAYHQLAAKNLSPTNDLDLWAHFNRASASLRLTAGVTGPETLECIERAELAASIVGGTERDRLELKLTRAQWLVLTEQFEMAVSHLTAIIEREELLASHVAAQAHFLLGQALSACGNGTDAVRHLTIGEELFLASGAEDRASMARGLVHSIEHPSV
ncbi:hypothetical protein PTW37_09805 [Arthrobacter agilis]|uniref:hypothetical protein n=1 Tax=Arthrobacter agilis TaxID=37921 RepID=UPI0023670718|nr:hypothetical protein [Arthrobacter agilis]WDF32173.1 hypothetical protein PTW37_09805 [Arthrobacter agilis]